VVNQIAFQVVGNDVTVTFAAEAGQLQLNAFEPIILATLMQSMRHLREGCRTLTTHCVSGITANTEHLRAVVEASIGLVTALSPHLGYEQSSAIAADALRTRRPVTELVLERQLLSPQRLAELLTPANLVHPLPAPEPGGSSVLE
jgi:aspartate ammonia-lyase